MKTAAQLRDGEVERVVGVRGATLHATELRGDVLGFRVRHVEWMDAGAPLVLTDQSTDAYDNYHTAVAEFHRQHLAATDQESVSR